MSAFSTLDKASGGHSSSTTPSARIGFRCFKRAIDILLAILLLPVLILICFIVSLLNPLLNPGSLFFTQERIGRNGTPFHMLKLRSMTGSSNQAKFADDEKGRITPFGAFLRARRIDELPQIINVLCGQMSFIGPRPEQPSFYNEFARTIPEYSARQLVRPGISGLAQVKSGYAACDSETRTKLRYDLYYIRNMDIRIELYITIQTLKVLATRFGAL